MDEGVISWNEFSSKVKNMHINRVGAPHPRQLGGSPKVEENFYANPFPGCVCEKPQEQTTNPEIDIRGSQWSALLN